MSLSEVRAINCPTCGAGQTIGGGGRIRTHVCSYCGSALDALDDFKLIEQFVDMKRPPSPLKLGDTGEIEGVPFTVIGVMGWLETYGHQSWAWVDHQIFSETHGYGWITHEDSGHLTFSRRLRDYEGRWYTSLQIEQAESRPAIWHRKSRFSYYETSEAEVTFVEGAFTFAPRKGDRATTVSFVAPGQMISMTGTAKEREVERSRLLTPHEQASFGIQASRSVGFSPLAVRELGPTVFFGLKAVGFSLLALIALWLVLSAMPTRNLYRSGAVDLANLPLSFDISTRPREHLLELRLGADVANAWAYLEIEVETSEGEPLLEGWNEISYYTGRDADGYWTEGRQQAWLTFNLPGPGDYTVYVDQIEGGSGETSQKVGNTWLMVDAWVSRFSTKPIFVAMGFFAGMLALFGVVLSGRRWLMLRGSDWEDED